MAKAIRLVKHINATLYYITVDLYIKAWHQYIVHRELIIDEDVLIDGEVVII